MERLDPQMADLLTVSAAEFRPRCGACRSPLRLQPFPPDIAFALVRQEFGISRDVLAGAGMTQDVVRARCFFTWLLKSLGAQRSYSQIGALLGGRDHSTTINQHRKAIALRMRDPAFAAACLRIGERWKSQGALDHAACH